MRRFQKYRTIRILSSNRLRFGIALELFECTKRELLEKFDVDEENANRPSLFYVCPEMLTFAVEAVSQNVQISGD
jgi:hypothetical protein